MRETFSDCRPLRDDQTLLDLGGISARDLPSGALRPSERALGGGERLSLHLRNDALRLRGVVVDGGVKLAWKFAVTERLASIVTVHVAAAPEQSPDQPAKVEPLAGVAVSVTTVPWSKSRMQVAPQSIPLGVLVTDPLPPPVFATVTVLRPGVAPTSAKSRSPSDPGPSSECNPPYPSSRPTSRRRSIRPRASG